MTAAASSASLASSAPVQMSRSNSCTNSVINLNDKWKLSKKESLSLSRTRSNRSTTSLVKNRRCCAFTRKCVKLVKEQRARFYIMRRCVTMLICWRNYSDSD